jgi:hypothetical protein
MGMSRRGVIAAVAGLLVAPWQATAGFRKRRGRQAVDARILWPACSHLQDIASDSFDTPGNFVHNVAYWITVVPAKNGSTFDNSDVTIADGSGNYVRWDITQPAGLQSDGSLLLQAKPTILVANLPVPIPSNGIKVTVTSQMNPRCVSSRYHAVVNNVTYSYV